MMFNYPQYQTQIKVLEQRQEDLSIKSTDETDNESEKSLNKFDNSNQLFEEESNELKEYFEDGNACGL